MSTPLLNYTVYNETANFRIIYDPNLSPFAFLDKRPNYYVVFKNTEKIEAATSSIFAAESMLEAAQGMYDRQRAGEPMVTEKEKPTPTDAAPDGGPWQ